MIFVKTICQPKPNFEIHPITRVRGKIKLSSLKLDKKTRAIIALIIYSTVESCNKRKKKKKEK